MVSIEEIQAAYYMVAATGVLIAAVFYILNLRVQQENMKGTAKNRRATLTRIYYKHSYQTKEWPSSSNYYQWNGPTSTTSRKYDSRVNPKNFALRMSLWNTCDLIGYQYRDGILDLSSIYNVGGIVIETIWEKFGPIIKEYRKRDYASDPFENFEYLAELITKMKDSVDSDYEGKKKRLLLEHGVASSASSQ